MIWLCGFEVAGELLIKIVVGNGGGGTSVYTAVGGAREGCDVEGFGSSDDSAPKARNKYKLNGHIMERYKPKLLQRNHMIELL